MARGLGELIVRLGLDASEFTTGLTKSERDAKRFAQQIDRGIATASNAAAIGLAAVGAAALAAFAAIDQLTKQAANFKDLEEKTGANAEALASFSVAAQVAGTNIASVAEATIKLTKNLTGVDDESKAAGAALTALNIPIKDFKALDPAAQLEVVAKALAGFQDGASKTAVALALFGKSGAEILPFLKELATGSGRVVILNQKLIEQADDYADKQARARAELNLYAQVAATQTLPAITALTTATKEFVRELLGVDTAGKQLRDSNAIGDFAESVAKSFAFIVDAGDSVVRIFELVGKAHAAQLSAAQELLKGNVAGAGEVLAAFKRDADAIIARQLFSARLQKQLDDQRRTSSLRNVEDRGFKPPGNPLVFAGPQKDIAGLKERQSEAERYLESLTRQAEKLNELTTVETLLADIQKGRLKGLTPELSDQLFVIAEQIDAFKALTKEIEKGQKAFEDEVRAVERASKERERNADSAFHEAEQIAKANDALRDEIAIILGGEFARGALEKARVADAIAIKEQALAEIQLDEARKGEASALEAQIALLKERQGLLSGRDQAKQLADEAKNIQDTRNLLSESFANSFDGFVAGTKSAKDALKSFGSDIEAMLRKAALSQLGDLIFGGKTGGTNPFSGILGILGLGGKTADAAGGAAGSAASTAAATALTASATGLTTAGVGLDTAGIGLTTAGVGLDTAAIGLTAAGAALTAAAAASAISGAAGALGGAAHLLGPIGGSFAGGTDFAPGGLSRVGEHGEELVNLPRGAQVIPNDVLRQRRAERAINVTNVIHPPPGASTQSMRQFAAMVRDMTMKSARER